MINKFKRESRPIKVNKFSNLFSTRSFLTENYNFKFNAEDLKTNEFRLFDDNNSKSLFVITSAESADKYDINESKEVNYIENFRVSRPKSFSKGENITPRTLLDIKSEKVKNKDENAMLIFNLSLLFYVFDGYAINYIQDELVNLTNIHVIEQALTNAGLVKVEEKRKNNIDLQIINEFMTELEKDNEIIYSHFEEQANLNKEELKTVEPILNR